MSNITPENLVPFTGTLKAGQRLLKLSDGSFVPIGTGGVAPDVSMHFYRCTSVDTSNATWSGRKAVLSEGVYSYQSNSTTGLTYTSTVPVVGNIYSSDMLIRVASLYTGIPTDGLVFYMPLQDDFSTEPYRSYTTFSDEPQILSIKGIKGYVAGGSMKILCNEFGIARNAGQFTLSYYAIGDSGRQGILFGSVSDWGPARDYEHSFALGSQFCDVDTLKLTLFDDSNTWHHVCMVFNDNQVSGYIDGNLAGTATWGTPTQQFNTSSTYMWLRAIPYSWNFTGSTTSTPLTSGSGISCIRIYNRQLSLSQIFSLSKQLTPTA